MNKITQTQSRIYYFVIIIIFPLLSFSQVGIGTSTPNSTMEIVGSGTNDGLLIPRVNNLDALGANQNSALVYLTTTTGTNTPGFYY